MYATQRSGGANISKGPRPATTGPDDLERLVQAHLDGWATDEDLAVLRSHADDWQDALKELLRQTKATLRNVRRRKDTPEKELVLADFEGQRERIEEVLAALKAGEEPPAARSPEGIAEADDGTS
ncbi:MAG: hypothetical protein KY457_11220, partial [Actinobacteria bacterium]|nr:hypothetical protein [Actinomycetota bacterium]